jgi:hypothetical protein
LAICHLERSVKAAAWMGQGVRAPVARMRRTSRWTASDVEKLRAEGRVR